MANVVTEVREAGVAERRPGFLLRARAVSVAGPLLALAIAIVFFSIKSDRFLAGPNLSLVLQQVMVVGTLAIGQTLIILTAGIDLSCGAVMALSSIFMTKLAVNSGMAPALAIF